MADAVGAETDRDCLMRVNFEPGWMASVRACAGSCGMLAFHARQAERRLI